MKHALENTRICLYTKRIYFVSYYRAYRGGDTEYIPTLDIEVLEDLEVKHEAKPIKEMVSACGKPVYYIDKDLDGNTLLQVGSSVAVLSHDTPMEYRTV